MNTVTQNACHICTIDSNVVYRSTHWRVILNIDQDYLGRCVIISERHAPSLSELNQEEWEKLHHIIQKTENAMKKAFPFTVFNWGCLMNHSFRKKPYDPHVHWHLFPRHENQITFNGRTWNDNAFGSHYKSYEKNILPEEEMLALYQHVKKAFDEQ